MESQRTPDRMRIDERAHDAPDEVSRRDPSVTKDWRGSEQSKGSNEALIPLKPQTTRKPETTNGQFKTGSIAAPASNSSGAGVRIGGEQSPHSLPKAGTGSGEEMTNPGSTKVQPTVPAAATSRLSDNPSLSIQTVSVPSAVAGFHLGRGRGIGGLTHSAHTLSHPDNHHARMTNPAEPSPTRRTDAGNTGFLLGENPPTPEMAYPAEKPAKASLNPDDKAAGEN